MKQGKAGYFPSLSVGTDWTHQMLSKTVSLEHSFKIGVQINTNAGSLSWEADIWGKKK
jgi:outer membrane protein TolC